MTENVREARRRLENFVSTNKIPLAPVQSHFIGRDGVYRHPKAKKEKANEKK